MSFLLDTNICSAYLKGDHRLFHRFLQYSGGLHVSAITAAELYTWAFRAGGPPARAQALADLLSEVAVLDVEVAVAERFGRVRAESLDHGRPVPQLDLLIGCTALVHDLTLVTHNVADFASIPGLRIEDWLAP